MAEFKEGDRIVKMSGACAGKYGTVNSVLDNGTLNVTFDGERLPRYCDPERCGAVAANSANNAVPHGYERDPRGGVLRKGMIVGWGNDAYKVIDDSDLDNVFIKRISDGAPRYVSDLTLDYPLRKKAANARIETARNGGEGKLKVTMQTITFQGRKSETRILTLDKLEELMKALGRAGLIQNVLQSLATRGSADFDVEEVEVDLAAL